MTAPQDEPADAPAISELEAEVEAAATDRVVTFSDAVVAIAITLLALDLPVPGGVHGLTDGQLLHQLGRDWPEYLAFLISFLAIGNHWATHRSIFRYACKWNALVGRLNMLWLLMMVMTPAGARLLAGTGAFGARFTLYALVQIVATAALMGMKLELARADLLRPSAPDRTRHPDLIPYLSFIVAFAVSIPFAFFTGWAYAFWAAVPLFQRVMRRAAGLGPRPPARHLG